jgi:hypothetical protein
LIVFFDHFVQHFSTVPVCIDDSYVCCTVNVPYNIRTRRRYLHLLPSIMDAAIIDARLNSPTQTNRRGRLANAERHMVSSAARC